MTKNTEVSVVEETALLEKVSAITRIYFGVAVGLGIVTSAMALVLAPLAKKVPAVPFIIPLIVNQVVDAKVTMSNYGTFQHFNFKAVIAGSDTILAHQASAAATEFFPSTAANGNLKIQTFEVNNNTNNPEQFFGFWDEMINLTYRRVGDTTDRLMTICVGENYGPSTTLYVGADGTTYTDIGLLNRATSESCQTIKNRALKFNTLTTAQLSSPTSEWPNQAYLFRRSAATNLGSLNPQGFQVGSDNLSQSFGDPLVIVTDPNSSTNDVTIPASIIQLTGVNQAGVTASMTICMPKFPVLANLVPPIKYFFAADGTAYTDIFLTQLFPDYGDTFTSCPEALARAFKPNDIISGSLDQPYPPNTPGHFQGYAVRGGATLGVWDNDSHSFIADGTFVSLPAVGSADSLAMSFGQGGPNRTESVHTPVRELTLQTNIGTSSLCLPEMFIPAGGSVRYYYDFNGTPFSDIFLTQPTDCLIQKITNIHTISTTQNSATIGWDTNIPTCGRINSGTVPGQLNTGPAGEDCWISRPSGTPFTTGHQVTITNLLPNTVYFYEIQSGITLVSGQLSFTTLPSPSGVGGGIEPLESQ